MERLDDGERRLINSALIRQLRQERGLSQEEVAAKIGISAKTLALFENNGYESIGKMDRINRRRNLDAIAKFYLLSDWKVLILPMPAQCTQNITLTDAESSQVGASIIGPALIEQPDSREFSPDPMESRNGPVSSYVPRGSEQTAIQYLLEARPVFVLAPYRFGKTSFWHAVRRGFPIEPCDQWLTLPLSGLSQQALVDVLIFERALLQRVDEQWGGTTELPSESLPFAGLCGRLYERLRAIECNGGRLLIFIDDFHVVYNAPFSRDFLAFWRARCDDKDAPWDRLRVLFASSLGLIDSPDGYLGSPLANIVQEIELNEFTRDEIGELADCYQLNRHDPNLAELFRLTGGHPHLTNLALEHTRHHSLINIVTQLVQDPGSSVLAPYIKTLWQWLRDQPDLMHALEAIVHTPGMPLNHKERSGLWRLGLIRLEIPRGYCLRSPVYKFLLNSGG